MQHILQAALAAFLFISSTSSSAGAGPMLAEALKGPMADVQEIIFAVRAAGSDGHWYANFGYWASNENQMMYGPDGGRLCRLNLRTGKVQHVLNDPGGSIRDPCVHYGGGKILFSYRQTGSRFFHLYEVNIDGSELRRLTDGEFDDIEAIYLPDGEILFCSSRCKRWVNCWHTHVAVRYRCDADGQDIRLLSSNVEHDNTPWMLPDGRVLYMRWEYIDRSRVKFHHLWTSNPDGSGEMVYYGNQHQGTVMLDAKPIPGTDKVASIFSPGHGRKEHAGTVAVIDAKAGPDEQSHARTISKHSNYRDVYPFSEDCFLAAEDDRIVLLGGKGQSEVIYKLPDGPIKYWCHEPRPLRPREREHIIPDRVDRNRETGVLVLADVAHGRNMKGVAAGEIKKLLVFEALPKPINHSGTMEPISLGGTFTLPRILGTVPVEADGSAHFEVPALRSLFFVALDKDEMSVKRMQSFVNVMPGEKTSCVGCHEHRTESVRPAREGLLAAMRHPPSKIQPIADAPDVFDFPRDVQPILDKHCVKCHGYDRRPDADLPLLGARSPWYSHAYYALMSRGFVSHGRDSHGNYPPRGIGSSASRLMTYLDKSHYDVRLSERERKSVRLWIDSGAPYAGTYAALGTGMIRIRPPQQILQKRCDSCHKKNRVSLTRHYDNELLYNLTDAARSPILLAPLAQKAGGWGACRNERPADKPKSPGAKPAPEAVVFASTDDADYQAILAEITKSKERLDQMKRFDMPDFRPDRHYIREMIRYGILSETFDPERDPIDAYEIDQAYWQSLWHRSGQ